MTRIFSVDQWRRLATMTSATLLMSGAATMAHSQTPSAGPVIDKLQQQVAALEKRVAELEKKSVVAVKDQSDTEAAAKKLEQRLANLEKQQENAKPDKTANQNHSESDKYLTVTAPFLVVDSSGKPLMRVGDAEETFSRGIYVYNKSGSTVAHLGVMTDDRGRVYVSEANKPPSAIVVAGSGGGSFEIRNDGKNVVSLNKLSLIFYDDAQNYLSQFGTKNRNKGYLELNEGGSKMIEAGVLANHKGYVLASPFESSVTPQGNPSILMGEGK